MTEHCNNSVLLIDDQCQRLVEPLTPAARAGGYDIFSTENALDGITFLKEYSQAICAVILDYSFPKGEMQGPEALEIIKKSHPNLPIIMLTDSDTSNDIEKVVDCISKGAFNYIGKRTLNPIYLFQVIDSAVQQSVIKKRLNLKNEYSESEFRFHTKVQSIQLPLFKYSGSFGFELGTVNKPNDDREIALLENAAMMWHENFFKTAGSAYQSELQVNLKFISECGKIRIIVLFTVYGRDETGLKETISSIQHDISILFTFSNNDKYHPYIFHEIVDDDFLLNANNKTESFQYEVFFREPLKFKPKNSIGFNIPVETVVSDTDKYCPDLLFPLPLKNSFNNGIFKALLDQKGYVEIDVELNPKLLLKEEIDLIKQVIDNPYSIDLGLVSSEDVRNYSGYLNDYIEPSHSKFMISVILKYSCEQVTPLLRSEIKRYFFGASTKVLFESRTYDKIQRFNLNLNAQVNQLPFFYPIAEASQPFRLPFPGQENIPGIKLQSNNFNHIPENLPVNGIQLGVKRLNKIEHQIRIQKDDLSRHLYIMGQTGTGKSTMLKTMIHDCLEKNEGFTIIDPHGDLFNEVQKMIPSTKKNKVFVIDTTNPENSMGLDPLSYNVNQPQEKSLAINELIRAFSSLYDMHQAGGPMFESYFKYCLLLLMNEKVQEKYGKQTLSDVSKIFYNDAYRRNLLETCEDITIYDFFKTAQATSGDHVFSNFAIYVTSKLNRFVEDYFLAPILTNKTKNVNFRKLIDDGNILMVKMDKGLIGAENTSLLGQILLSKLFMAGMSRSKTSIETRRSHYIFIDEFQNFVKGDAGSALSEVRKYGLNLILANQTLGQLDDFLVESLLGNVGSLVFFRPGITDYERLKYYVEPEFNRDNVLKLPNFNCIARLMIDNAPSDPFVFQTKRDI